MAILLTLIFPLIIISLPLICFSNYKSKIKINKRKKILIGGLLTLLIGITTPLIATFVSVYGIGYDSPNSEPVCATGAGVFFFFGNILTFIGTPILGLIYYLSSDKT
jgi:hypothetical protein